MQATLFSGDNHSRVAREEIFGPVIIIIPFDNEDQALAIANDSQYGLAGGIWCADAERARTLAKRLRTGRVRINGAPLNKRGTHGGFKRIECRKKHGRTAVDWCVHESVLRTRIPCVVHKPSTDALVRTSVAFIHVCNPSS